MYNVILWWNIYWTQECNLLYVSNLYWIESLCLKGTVPGSFVSLPYLQYVQFVLNRELVSGGWCARTLCLANICVGKKAEWYKTMSERALHVIHKQIKFPQSKLSVSPGWLWATSQRPWKLQITTTKKILYFTEQIFYVIREITIIKVSFTK